MTTDRICHYLHNPGGLDKSIHRALIPVANTNPDLSIKLEEMFRNVRELRHQRNGLIQAIPANADQYRRQFQDLVRKLAEQWQADLEEIT